MDGVMQAPGGAEEDRESKFSHGGWSLTYWDTFMGEVMAEEMAGPREVLLGRKTYEIFAEFWPKHRDQSGAKELNAATKYVASRTLRSLEWENSHLLDGEASAAVQKVKSTPGPDLQVIGSSNLLQTLLRADLVDQVELWMFPVVLGGGKRLFGEGVAPGAWRLIDHRSSTTGVQILRYERAGPIQYGRPPGT
jgi:dihydrofolate reductase